MPAEHSPQLSSLHTPLGGIADIEPPLPPLAGSGTEVLFASLGLAFIAVAGYLLWRHHAGLRGQSRRHLSRLRRRYLAGQLDSHTAAFQLATILRQRLAVPRLAPSPSLPPRLQPQLARWQVFIEDLSTARYAPGTASRETMLTLFEDAHYWLKHWP